MSGVRYPLEPIEELIGHGEIHSRMPHTSIDRPSTSRRVGEVLGVPDARVRMWRSRGLSAMQADRIAIAIGSHPALVWPEWLEEVAV